MILGGAIGGKASEPWLLWEGITKVTEVIQERLLNIPKAHAGHDRSPANSIESAPFDITGRSSKGWRIGTSIQNKFWLVLQYVFLALTATRFLIISVATSTALPSRIQPTMKLTRSVYLEDETESPRLTNSKRAANRDYSPTPSSKQPILRMKIWSCAAQLLDLSVRMPWLCATISMLQWAAITGPWEVGNTDGMIDK
jgi:hypothetical protein